MHISVPSIVTQIRGGGQAPGTWDRASHSYASIHSYYLSMHIAMMVAVGLLSPLCLFRFSPFSTWWAYCRVLVYILAYMVVWHMLPQKASTHEVKKESRWLRLWHQVYSILCLGYTIYRYMSMKPSPWFHFISSYGFHSMKDHIPSPLLCAVWGIKELQWSGD